VHRSASLILAAAMLAGCGGAQPAGEPGLVPSVSPSLARHAKHASHGRPWMDAGAAQWDLLYVSNGNGVVNVYRYWQYKLIGVLTDFGYPQGECVDNVGDVFITDYEAQDIVEYAHGGKKPINIINDSPYVPVACAVDLKNGSLAVANAGFRGNIAVYKHAKGKPLYYTDNNLYGYAALGYDDSGNLLTTDGCTFDSSCYGASFAYLPQNGVNLETIQVPGPSSSDYYEDVRGVAWDGKYWVIDDYYLYQISISGGKAHYIGYVGLSPSVGPTWFYRKNGTSPATQVVGAVYSDNSNFDVDYWEYPAGGNPVHSVSKGLDDPYGVTISLKK
jgi:hypothetical protein